MENNLDTGTRQPRFPIRLSAELKIDARTVTGTTRNLSLSGVCIELDRRVSEGKVLRITLFVVEEDIELEGASTLDLTGTVQWCAEGDQGYAMGLHFRNLNATQKVGLERVLQSLGQTA